MYCAYHISKNSSTNIWTIIISFIHTIDIEKLNITLYIFLKQAE